MTHIHERGTLANYVFRAGGAGQHGLGLRRVQCADLSKSPLEPDSGEHGFHHGGHDVQFHVESAMGLQSRSPAGAGPGMEIHRGHGAGGVWGADADHLALQQGLARAGGRFERFLRQFSARPLEESRGAESQSGQAAGHGSEPGLELSLVPVLRVSLRD